MKLLLIEVNSLLGDGLRVALSQAGCAVTWVKYGKVAIDLLNEGQFAAVLMNISVPDMRGLDLLRTIRSNDNTLPIIVLGANATTHDKVVSLESGADDYVLKSVAMEELVARLRAVVRRSRRTEKVLIVGNLRLDTDNHQVTLDGRAIEVSNREFTALRTLLEGVGRVLTRSQLETSLYGWGQKVESNAVEVHIHKLRQKLGPATIKTVRGVGYTVTAPVTCHV